MFYEGFHSLGYDAASVGTWILIFWGSIMSSSSGLIGLRPKTNQHLKL